MKYLKKKYELESTISRTGLICTDSNFHGQFLCIYLFDCKRIGLIIFSEALGKI